MTPVDASVPPAPPPTLSPFAALGLEPRLVEPLTAAGYAEPTPIQREAIPPLLAGKDLIGLAATGTGKTAAFALPLIQRLAAGPRKVRPAALILVPTRELCMQVAAAVGRYGKPLGITVQPVYGGAGFADQVRAIRNGVDVVVATPGRALDHLRRGTLKLDGVQAAVLDEADEMLDMGFAEDIETLLSATPAGRQTMLFSATMPPRIAGIAGRHLSDPVRVEVARPVVAAGQAHKVRHTAYVVPRDFKTLALARILEAENPAAALVFCRTRVEADGVADALAACGHRSEVLHGGLSQELRDRVMKKFRDGAANLLVATDVAARGLDISHLSHVVNFGVPQAAETYVHRTGRVGRAGREGIAITVAEPRERNGLRQCERSVGRAIEAGRVPTPADLRAKRLDRTRASLREALAAGGLDEFRAAVAPLLAEFPPADVAAATLALYSRLGRSDDDNIEIPSLAPARPEPRPARGAGFGPPGGGRPPQPQRPGMARVYVGAGRFDRFGPRELVDALGHEVGLAPRDVGSIDVAERFSLVEVPGEIADQVVDALQGMRVRGRRIVVRRDRDPAPRF